MKNENSVTLPKTRTRKKVSPSSQSNNFCWRLLLRTSNENGTADESKDVTIRKEKLLYGGLFQEKAIVRDEVVNVVLFVEIKRLIESWAIFYIFLYISRRYKTKNIWHANQISALTNDIVLISPFSFVRILFASGSVTGTIWILWSQLQGWYLWWWHDSKLSFFFKQNYDK
jgi:hypothetical protein